MGDAGPAPLKARLRFGDLPSSTERDPAHQEEPLGHPEHHPSSVTSSPRPSLARPLRRHLVLGRKPRHVARRVERRGRSGRMARPEVHGELQSPRRPVHRSRLSQRRSHQAVQGGAASRLPGLHARDLGLQLAALDRGADAGLLRIVGLVSVCDHADRGARQRLPPAAEQVTLYAVGLVV